MNEFENIGKKMPYAVPEGFFEHSRKAILSAAIEQDLRRVKRRRYLLGASWVSVAAAVAVVATVVTLSHPADVVVAQEVHSNNIDEVLRSMSDDNLASIGNAVAYDYFTVTQN